MASLWRVESDTTLLEEIFGHVFAGSGSGPGTLCSGRAREPGSNEPMSEVSSVLDGVGRPHPSNPLSFIG